MTDSSELKRRIDLIRSQLEEGKMQLSAHLVEDFRRDWAAIQYDQTGNPVAESVSGRIRSLGAMVAGTQYREKTKNLATLSEIQNTYFGILEANFGQAYEHMVSVGADPHDFAYSASRNSRFVSEYSGVADEFIGYLTEFWDATEETARYHLQDLQCLKSIHGGDLFPSSSHNIASSAGIYVDTIILGCPFMQSKRVFPYWDKQTRAMYLLKHALNVLKYKELATVEIDIPIVAILPFRSSIDKDASEWLPEISKPDILAHGSSIFQMPFSEIDEFLDFTSSLTTIEQIERSIKNPERLLFDTSWTGSLREQIEKSISLNPEFYSNHSLGASIGLHVFGRMNQANDILLKSRELSGTPILDAPTSWQHLVWKMEYGLPQELSDSKTFRITHELLSSTEDELRWIGNIPPTTLIEMRKSGALAEIREVLSRGIEAVATAQEDSYENRSQSVIRNVEAAFREYSNSLEEIDRKKSLFFGRDVMPWLAVGSIELAAAFSGNPIWGSAAFVAGQITDIPKLRELPKRYQTIIDLETKLKRTPTALLFRHKH